MNTTPQADKDAVYAAVNSYMQKYPNKARHCLYWAMRTCSEVRRMLGVRVVFQAGNAYWPCCCQEHDDGVRPLRFGYQWELPASEMHQSLFYTALTRKLPEIHIWAAIPDRGEIIDLTTGLWPEAAREVAKLEWDSDILPPTFFWGTVKDIPNGVEYTPVMDACGFVLALTQIDGLLTFKS